MSAARDIEKARTTNDSSGVWRARFAGRFACEGDASNDDGSSETQRYVATVHRSDAKTSSARGFWCYDERARGLRWVVRAP